MPNDHQGPISSWFGPEQRHGPWQSSGPNELISQLEALDVGMLGGAKKGEGARYEAEESSPTW